MALIGINDTLNGYEWVPKQDRPRILFLADDPSAHSGVGTMAREIIEGTCHRFNYLCIGGALQHPHDGKLLDVSKEIETNTGIVDAEVIIRATTGYGNPQLVRELMSAYKVDAILHFTDPRQWIWLYQMGHELRQEIPIMYYHVWDNLPFPMYNKPYYNSCDLIMNISKLAYAVSKVVRDPAEDWQLTYVPHGINPDKYFPIPDSDPKLIEFKKNLFQGKDFKFTVLFSSVNMRRKMPTTIAEGFREFINTLTEEQKKECAFILHTQPVNPHGTDLIALLRDLCPEVQAVFSVSKLSIEDMNHLYNAVDVIVNASSAEGFGLTTAEAIMAGTPAVVTVTGGLQDQCGFSDPDTQGYADEATGGYIEHTKYGKEWATNSDKRYEVHGPWVYPMFPAVKALVGAPPTPYIYDEYVSTEDVTKGIAHFYSMTRTERRALAERGRRYFLHQHVGISSSAMCNNVVKDINTCLEKFTPLSRYNLYSV